MMYEDPNVSDRQITVVFTYASDDEHDDEMRGEIRSEVEELAERVGCSYEVREP